MQEIISNIRKIICSNGQKQKYIAEKMQINERKMSDILNGRKVLDAEIILSLCNALEVSPNQLLGYEESK